MASYLVDTDVLLRSATPGSNRHVSATAAVAALLERGDELLIAPQLLVEFWSVATRPVDVNGFGWPVDTVHSEVDRLLDQFPLLPETPAVFSEWLRLVSLHGIIGKQVHDARLVAVLNVYHIPCLLTFNSSDFQKYDISVVSPEDIHASGAKE